MTSEQRPVSVIIPTRNEQELLQRTLRKLQDNDVGGLVDQIIVVDANSTDDTARVARRSGATVLNGERPSRAAQMNQGARAANGDILYFLHGDSYPPKGFSRMIQQQVQQGHNFGCFMSKFDRPHPFLRFCNWFSRFPFWWCRGGGQSLFITRKVFDRSGGFDEGHQLMEEYEFIARVRKTEGLRIIKEYVITSARDYRNHGAFRLQWIYAQMFRMYAQGASQEELRSFVRSRLQPISTDGVMAERTRTVQ